MEKVKTSWGQPSDDLMLAKLNDIDICFHQDILEDTKLVQLILILEQILMQ